MVGFVGFYGKAIASQFLTLAAESILKGIANNLCGHINKANYFHLSNLY